MVTPDEEREREPVDPVYASLFRPEDRDLPPSPEGGEPTHEPDAEADPDAEPQEADPPSADEPSAPADPVPDSGPQEEGGPASQSVVDTGRLFRSQGVADNTAAVLALASDHGGRLRTLVREQQDPAGPLRVNSAVAVTGAAMVVDDASVLDDAEVKESRSDRRRHRAAGPVGQASPGISAGAVYLIVIGSTALVGLLNAWLGGGELGWPTGIALLLSSTYCAWRVRREDDVVAILTPPIAFFVAAITAGQLFRGTTGGGLLNRAQLIFFTMAYNWYWVIGTTVVAVVLVLVRRRRG